MDCINFYEKTTTHPNSFSASLPTSIHLESHFNRNMEGNTPKSDNIIGSRRKSESFAEYSGQEFVYTQTTQNCQLNAVQNEEYQPDWREISTATDSAFMSPDTINHHFYPHFHGQLQQQQQSSISSSAINLDKKIVLYKTEMCRTFEETGTCKYGIKCQFAHDPVEVRTIPRHPRYKTEICKTFWQLGNCPYGKRCCFIHTEHELKEVVKSTESTTSNSNSNSSNGNNSKIDIYGTVDLNITEDHYNTHSSNHSSRTDSPSKLAEELKRTITNIGAKSIFNNLSEFLENNASDRIDQSGTASDSSQSSMPTAVRQRRRSILEDKLNEELSMMIGSGTIKSDKEKEKKREDGTTAMNMNDKSSTISADPKAIKSTIDEENDADFFNKININTSIDDSSSKFDLFDKSPGSKASFPSKFPSKTITANPHHDIWAKNGNPLFFTTAGGEKLGLIDSSNRRFTSSTESSGSSSKASSTGSGSPSPNHYLLMDMINLLDSQ